MSSRVHGEEGFLRAHPRLFEPTPPACAARPIPAAERVSRLARLRSTACSTSWTLGTQAPRMALFRGAMRAGPQA